MIALHSWGFFVCWMMVRFNYGIPSTNIDNGIFKSFFNIQINIYGCKVHSKEESKS